MSPLRFGIVSKTATYWPYYVGLREGLFAEQGLELEFVPLGTTHAGVPALLEGRVDLAATCPDALVASVLEGAPLRVVGGLINRPVSSVIAVPAVLSFADVRGRRVAVTEAHGSVSTFLRAVLRRKGLADGDYEQVVCATTPEQVAALERGAVDMAMLTHPFENRLLKQGFHRLARIGDELGTGAFTTLNGRRGWTSQPEWHSLRVALEAADRFLRDTGRKSSATAALVEATGVPQDELDETYELYAGDSDVLARAGELDLSGFGRLLTFMAEDGSRVQPTSARDFLDDFAAVR